MPSEVKYELSHATLVSGVLLSSATVSTMTTAHRAPAELAKCGCTTLIEDALETVE